MSLNPVEQRLLNELTNLNQGMICSKNDSYKSFELKKNVYKAKLYEIMTTAKQSELTKEFRCFLNEFHKYCEDTLESLNQSNFWDNRYWSKIRKMYPFFITENDENYRLAQSAGLNTDFETIKCIIDRFDQPSDYAARKYTEFTPYLQEIFHTDFLEYYKALLTENMQSRLFWTSVWTLILIGVEASILSFSKDFDDVLFYSTLVMMYLIIPIILNISVGFYKHENLNDNIYQLETSSSIQVPEEEIELYVQKTCTI